MRQNSISVEQRLGPYVLVTAARNEEATIARTINAVVNQTVTPRCWVIVSDGSTDQTDEIVFKYTARHNFIRFLRRSGDRKRNFGSKVNAIREGIKARLCDVDYEFIGILDADITFCADYYEQLLTRFRDDPSLGIGGGRISDVVQGKVINTRANLNSVGSAVQMFRRQCYENIGGYLPLRAGGEDAAAEIMTRMHGWRVKSFPEFSALHHRRTGTAATSVWHARFNSGIEDFSLGSHPLFFLVKCGGRIVERPYLIGSLLMGLGYLWSALWRTSRQVPHEVVEYLRQEQKYRLLSAVPFVRPRVRDKVSD